MANADTKNAIYANLCAILTAQGFSVNDSSSDPDLETTPLAVPLQVSGGSDRHSGQNPSKGQVDYIILILFSAPTPADTENKVNEYVDKVRDPFTIPALNVGALATTKTKLVIKLPREDYSVDYQPGVTTISQPLTIHFGQP